MKKIRKGDVVVYTGTLSPDFYGEIGVVTGFSHTLEGGMGINHTAGGNLVDVKIDSGSIQGIVDLNLEVIDHDESLLEEPSPEVIERFSDPQRGDVVVVGDNRPHTQSAALYGRMGLVTQVFPNAACPFASVDFYDVVGWEEERCLNSQLQNIRLNALEIIDHDEDLLKESDHTLVILHDIHDDSEVTVHGGINVPKGFHITDVKGSTIYGYWEVTEDLYPEMKRPPSIDPVFNIPDKSELIKIPKLNGSTYFNFPSRGLSRFADDGFGNKIPVTGTDRRGRRHLHLREVQEVDT